MRRYLFFMSDEQEKTWIKFKKVYKKDGLGTNLTDAVFTLINKYLKGRK